MDDYLKQQALDSITKANKVLIVVSQKTGFDGLASGLAVYLSLAKLGKTSALIAKSPTVEEANKLYGVDKIGSGNDKKNLVINIENAITNVDKVTYSLEGSKLRVVVHSLPNSLGVSESDISFSKEGSNADLIIAIGYRSSDELNNDIVHEQIIDSKAFIINVSNVKPNNNFAQINILQETASGVSEVMTRLVQELALPIDEDISFNLYTGISFATHNFSPAYATPMSFESAQWLIKFGAGKASFASAGKTEPASANQLNIAETQTTTGEFLPKEEEIISEKSESEEDWLKPPKIYHGSKSFDTDS